MSTQPKAHSLPYCDLIMLVRVVYALGVHVASVSIMVHNACLVQAKRMSLGAVEAQWKVNGRAHEGAWAGGDPTWNDYGGSIVGSTCSGSSKFAADLATAMAE